ncbi:MAG: 50S ribosomal protein L4, partial [Fimbriimonadales bacterium]|nr:50S ribosomal protein L4 [Fimbriimonadales bacterium]
MSVLKVLDTKGKVKGEVSLSDAVTETEIRPWVLHRAVVTEEANRRQGTHSVKNRATIRGGGRKPWRQKKTGRARQGSIWAPHWRHGAVAHGPRPRDYDLDLNKKERRLALRMAFASRVKSGDVVVVDSLTFDKPRTKS